MSEIVFVTKYALSKGIESVEVKPLGGDDSYRHSAVGWNQFAPGAWHTNRDDAVKRAEQMRAAKIASLRKQIAKLEKLKFEPPSHD